jgi:hypothetical protein
VKRKRVLTWMLGMGVVGIVGWLLWPGGARVEVGVVGRGGMEVVVAAEGRTRVKDRYVVSAPLAGRLGRIGLKPGDRVEAGRTVLAGTGGNAGRIAECAEPGRGGGAGAGSGVCGPRSRIRVGASAGGA